MTDYVPPQPEQNRLLRAALARAATQYGPNNSSPSIIDGTIATRARFLVSEVNELPSEQQPDGWKVTDDPHAQVARLHGLLNTFVEEENEHLRADRKAERLFSITWDHDFVNLWCEDCPDGDRPVDLFPGNPTGIAEIMAAMRKHRAEQHGEES